MLLPFFVLNRFPGEPLFPYSRLLEVNPISTRLNMRIVVIGFHATPLSQTGEFSFLLVNEAIRLGIQERGTGAVISRLG